MTEVRVKEDCCSVLRDFLKLVRLGAYNHSGVSKAVVFIFVSQEWSCTSSLVLASPYSRDLVKVVASPVAQYSAYSWWEDVSVVVF